MSELLSVDEERELIFAHFVESTAKACHEANKMYCESIGDTSQPDWENASDHAKQSAYSGVLYALENPEVTPEEMHKNWMRDKVKAGWIYGPVKNENARMHPCIVPYDKLPLEQREKDDIFIAVVTAMTESYNASLVAE